MAGCIQSLIGHIPWGVWTLFHWSSLRNFFHAFNFRSWPQPQNYFNSEMFPIYGIYILFITVTFSHYIQRGKTLVVPGPDVLTSCGDPGRLLRLREEYVVGIGGFCNPISDWSTVSSYSSSELNLLTELASGCKGDCMSNQVPGTYSLALFLVHLSFFLSSYSG